jgi:hypothetical protein
MTAISEQLRPVVAALFILLVCAACNGRPFERITPGMTRREVAELLGPPSRAVDDPKEIEALRPRGGACHRVPATVVLVYHVRMDDSWLIHFDSVGHVTCTEKTFVFDSKSH